MVCKKLVHNKKCNKVRNSDCDNKECSPESLKLNALLIDEKCKNHTTYVVGKCCKESPNNCPAKNLTKGIRLFRVIIENIRKVLKTYPSKELLWSLMELVIVCESNKDCKYNRKDCKAKDKSNRKAEKSDVKTLIKEYKKLPLNADWLFASLNCFLCSNSRLDIHKIEYKECNSYNHCHNAYEKNVHRVITLNLSLNTPCILFNMSFYCTKCEEL